MEPLDVTACLFDAIVQTGGVGEHRLVCYLATLSLEGFLDSFGVHYSHFAVLLGDVDMLSQELEVVVELVKQFYGLLTGKDTLGKHFHLVETTIALLYSDWLRLSVRV